MIDIDKLEALEKAATPGPWLAKANELLRIGSDSIVRPLCVMSSNNESECIYQEEDAEFVATARNALPELLAEVRRLRRIEEMASTLIDYEDANYHGEGEPWVWDAKFADLRSALCSPTE